MIYVAKLLYMANFFYKQALWPQEQEISKAQNLISWLIGRTISFDEIKFWLIQNQNILNEFNIYSFERYHKENFEHYIVYKEIVNADIKYTIISDNKSVSDDIKLDVNKEGFLKGYKNIPNLYLFIAIDSGFKEDPGTKEDVKYKFMDFFLKEIGNLNDHEFKLEKDKFIKNNKDKLDKLIYSFDYYPKLIGEGDDGAAFSVSPNLVFKIFKDQFSYLKAKESFERLHNNPEFGKNEAMIYDIGILGEFSNTTIYYYIIEKMETLNTTMKNYLAPIVGAIGTYIRKNSDIFKEIKKQLYDSKNHYNLKTYLNFESDKIKDYIINNYSDQIETIESAEDLHPEWIKNLAEEILFKHFTDRNDLHLGNLGITNYGKFIYFDPSHEVWENDKINILNTPQRDSIDFLEQDNIKPDTFDNLFI